MPQRITASLKIVRALQQQILDKRYSPGERLPTERELAMTYGVSRIPVREALKILAQQGLVDIKHGSGNYVKHIEEDKIAEQIGQFIFMSGGSVKNLGQIWQALEVAAAKGAARKRSDDDLRMLWELHDTCAMHINHLLNRRTHAFFEVNRNLHLAIGHASKNSILANIIYVFHNSMHINDELMAESSEDLPKLHSLHASIITAIENQDEPEAEKAIMAEFTLSNEIFERYAGKLSLPEIIDSAFLKFIYESN